MRVAGSHCSSLPQIAILVTGHAGWASSMHRRTAGPEAVIQGGCLANKAIWVTVAQDVAAALRARHLWVCDTSQLEACAVLLRSNDSRGGLASGTLQGKQVWPLHQGPPGWL